MDEDDTVANIVKDDTVIADALDMSPMPIETKEVAVVEEANNKPAVPDNDFEYARNNMKIVIEKGIQVLDELATIASQSQHPRAYEVLSTHMDNLIKAQRDLLDLSKVNVEMGGNVTNNNQLNQTKIDTLVVAPTSEIQKLLANLNKK